MRYSTFERLIVGIGAAAVAASMVFSIQNQMPAHEIVAQLLILVVLVGAVHWGRTGGFITALAASGIYLVMRIPLALGVQGLAATITPLLVIRLLTYGLIGIVGGELCGRIRYIFARLEDAASIDDWSRVFNQKFILRSLESARGQHARYDTPYSLVLVTISPKILDGLRSSKQRVLVRGVANHIRNDIRLVDEVGRLDDGSFLVVLPQTPKPGADIVAERLRAGVCATLGAKEESITMNVIGAPDDDAEIETLAARLSAFDAPRIYTEESDS